MLWWALGCALTSVAGAQPPPPPPVKMALPLASDAPAKAPTNLVPKEPPAPAPAPMPPAAAPAARPVLPPGVPPPPVPTPRSIVLPPPQQGPAIDAGFDDVAAPIDPLAVRLARARAMANQGDPAALAAFAEYLAARPDDADAREEWASALGRTRDFDRALEQWRRVMALRPERAPRCRLELGNLLVQAKRLREALQEFAAGLQAIPAQPDALQRVAAGDLAVAYARALAFDQDYTGARQVLAERLPNVAPTDPRAPRLLGAVLHDLGDHADALAALEAALPRQPADAELHVFRCRAALALEDHGRWQAALGDFVRRANGKPDGLLLLAEMLLETDETAAAEEVLAHALSIAPRHDLALALRVRQLTLQWRLCEATALLKALVPTERTRRDLHYVGAELLARRGEYADARQLLQGIVEADPCDSEARLKLGQLFEYMLDFDRARAEYAKVDARTAFALASRVAAVRCLTQQRKFAEACRDGWELLHDWPQSPAAVDIYARALAKAGNADEAIALLRKFAGCVPNLGAVAVARQTLGRVLLEARRYTESVHAYHSALAHRVGRNPFALQGKERAEGRGRIHDLGGLFAAASKLDPREERKHFILLADAFAEDHDDPGVALAANVVLKHEADHLAALARLVEARQREAIQSWDTAPARVLLARLLECSPRNSRGWLALARLEALDRCYDKALDAYDRLRELDPDFSIAWREKARTLYSANRHQDSTFAYAAFRGADAALEADVRGAAERDPGMRSTLEAYLAAKLPGPALVAKIEEAAAGECLPNCAAPLRSAVLDYAARKQVEEYFRLEDCAKQLRGLRDYSALPAYRRLLETEPANTEGWFDLGQTHSSLKFTQNAVQAYAQTMEVDPLHRDSGIAADRALHEANAKLNGFYSFASETGRGGLARIQRHRAGFLGTFPLGDETDYWGVGFARALYIPKGDTALAGNIVTGVLQRRLTDHWLGHATVNYEQFESRFQPRPTFDAFLENQFDLGTFRLRAFLENISANGETMRRDIFRTGGGGDFNLRLTRRAEAGGHLQYSYYSDRNTQLEAGAQASYVAAFLPCQWKFVASADYQRFREPANDQPDVPDLRAAKHPYFAPNGYYFYQGRLEYTRVLSRDFFTHANSTWYTLHFGTGWDSNFANFQMFRALFNHDLSSAASVGVDFRATVSSAYTGVWTYAYVNLRWPLQNCAPGCP